jgi:hypothetical protein
MTGRTRLPGGEPRKASQRNKRSVASSGAAKLTPVWRASMSMQRLSLTVGFTGCGSASWLSKASSS